MRFQGVYAPHIAEYLKLKRNLGFKLRDAEYIFCDVRPVNSGQE